VNGGLSTGQDPLNSLPDLLPGILDLVLVPFGVEDNANG
jgi:hypothetical protein